MVCHLRFSGPFPSRQTRVLTPATRLINVVLCKRVQRRAFQKGFVGWFQVSAAFWGRGEDYIQLSSCEILTNLTNTPKIGHTRFFFFTLLTLHTIKHTTLSPREGKETRTSQDPRLRRFRMTPKPRKGQVVHSRLLKRKGNGAVLMLVGLLLSSKLRGGICTVRVGACFNYMLPTSIPSIDSNPSLILTFNRRFCGRSGNALI